MKKMMMMVVLLAIASTFVGCQEGKIEGGSSNISGKIAINVSGEVVEVDADKVKLDDGKWILITDSTVFAGDPDNGAEVVDDTIEVGNFIQGYSEEPDADIIIMLQINNNTKKSKPAAKVAVNISGTIVEVAEGMVKLDNGMWVEINDQTIFGDDPDNGVEPVSNDLQIGNHLVGYTMDDISKDRVIAYRIYSNEPKQ